MPSGGCCCWLLLLLRPDAGARAARLRAACRQSERGGVRSICQWLCGSCCRQGWGLRVVRLLRCCLYDSWHRDGCLRRSRRRWHASAAAAAPAFPIEGGHGRWLPGLRAPQAAAPAVVAPCTAVSGSACNTAPSICAGTAAGSGPGGGAAPAGGVAALAWLLTMGGSAWRLQLSPAAGTFKLAEGSSSKAAASVLAGAALGRAAGCVGAATEAPFAACCSLAALSPPSGCATPLLAAAFAAAFCRLN